MNDDIVTLTEHFKINQEKYRKNVNKLVYDIEKDLKKHIQKKGISMDAENEKENIIEWLQSSVNGLYFELVERLQEIDEFDRGSYQGQINAYREALMYIKETFYK